MTQTTGLGRKTAVLFIFISLFLILAIRGSLVGAAEQVDIKAPNVVTTSLDMQFSSDGVTFSDNLTVNQGDTVWVRLNYDNSGDEQGTGVAAALTLPAGFTLVSSSTKTCLTPSGAETVCNSHAGMGGAITEGSVWTGQALAIAPQAGLYAEAVGATSGILEFGKVRYVNLHECRSEIGGTDIFYTSLLDTGTNASNTADGTATCTGVYAGYTTTPNQVLNLDLLGRRYFNVQDCQYVNGADRIAVNTGNTATSNTSIAVHSCPPTAGAHTYEDSDVSALDLSGNPFLNLKECQLFASPDNISYNLKAGADTNTSSATDTVNNCTAGGSPGYAVTGNTQLPLDVRDNARGAGYIEFQMTAGATAGAHTFSPTLDGNEFPQQTDSGNVTVAPLAPMTLIVTNVDDADDGVCSPAPAHCSLREAINYANPGDTINFDADITNGTVILDPSTNGALAAIDDLVIDGTTRNITITNLTYPATIFNIASDKSATFRNLTMILLGGASGTTHVSGLVSLTHGGSLTLDTVTVQDSNVVEYGFIYAGLNSGTITPTVAIIDSTFTNNVGGTYASSIMSMGPGVLTVTNSSFTNNTASAFYGGVFSINGEATIENSSFISNTTVAAHGGAIGASGVMTVTNSTFQGNSAAGYGGAIYSTGALIVNNVDFVNNSANQGAAISNNVGVITVTNSTFVDNTANFSGGGIFTADAAQINDSSFSGNSAVFGGGLDISTGSYTTIVNSTFYSNTGTTGGGGIRIYDTSTLTATNVTLSDNASASGGGLYVADGNGTINLINTIIANSVSGGDCVNNGTMATNNSNLIEDATCSPTISGDPMLGVLEATGLGGTSVLPLLVGSPAINAADTADAPATDQRGVARPQGADADIGAYEADSAALSLGKTAVDLNNAPLIVGDEILYTITVTNELGTAQDSIVITDAIPANTTYVAGSASVTQGSVSGPNPLVADIGTLAAGASATFTFRVTVNAATVGATIQNTAQAASPDQPTPIEVGPIEPAGGGEVVASADLSIAQSIAFDHLITNFIIVVTNNGESAAPGAVVSVTFPVEFENVTWTCAGTNCPNTSGTGNTLNETLSSFPKGAVVTYTVSTSVSGQYANAAEVIPPVDVFDYDMSNNSDAQFSRYLIILPIIYNNASFN